MSSNIANKLLNKPPKNGKFYLVAIDGRGGSGKTTLASYLISLLPGFTVINGDDYFEPTPNAIAWGAFNDKRFAVDVIEPIKQKKTILKYKPYDWHTKPHIKERNLTINKGVVIERNMSLSFNLDWDLKIWIEIPANLALKRGMERDKMPREEAVIAWKEVWQPAESAHIKKIRPLQTSDLVIDGTKPFEEQIS